MTVTWKLAGHRVSTKRQRSKKLVPALEASLLLTYSLLFTCFLAKEITPTRQRLSNLPARAKSGTRSYDSQLNAFLPTPQLSQMVLEIIVFRLLTLHNFFVVFLRLKYSLIYISSGWARYCM